MRQSMRCCRTELSHPDIVDGTAYFVCSECGNVLEVDNYRVYTTEESFSFFEEKFGFCLPKEYEIYSGTSDTKVVELPATEKESLKFYFSEGFYVIDSFASVDPNDEHSLHQTISSGREWGLSSALVPLDGDGHTWLALDYSESNSEPGVIVTETDNGHTLLVATSFKEFISNLLNYEDVYDPDGNIVYKKRNT